MNLKKTLYISIVAGALIYLGMSLTSNWSQLQIAWQKFVGWVFPLVLLLTLLNYLLRFLRWQLLLKKMNISCDIRTSVKIFSSGLVMVISPGKIGELFKSWLLKKEIQVPVADSLPVVVMERLMDLIGLLILSAIGISFLNLPIDARYMSAFYIMSALIIAVVVVLLLPKLAIPFLEFSANIPVAGKFAAFFKTVYLNSNQLVKPAMLTQNTVISLAAWLCEAIGFHLILTIGFGLSHPDFSPFISIFIYCFATLAGVVSPGGIGVTDSILVALCSIYFPVDICLLAAFFIRLATLWFGILCGAVSLTVFFPDTDLSQLKQDDQLT